MSVMNQTNHDVIVVGSGASGGMVAHRLTQAGVRVLMLEAGRNYDPVSETPMFQWPKDAPLRSHPTPDKPGPVGYYDATIGGWELPGEPFIVAEGSRPFHWWRARMLGGRTNHWARHVPRYGPDDFKPRSRTGRGRDWPISYEDMKPYYDRTEELVGVFGPDRDYENSPAPSAAFRQPPPQPRAYELLFQRACRELGMPCHTIPIAVLTEPLNGRSPCFYATSCFRGCSIGAAFQSPIGFIEPARRTGNLTLVTDAMVHEVIVDPAGQASGVRYIDKKTGKGQVAHARAVILAASSYESCRILLNSRSGRFPNGAANASGLVGRGITETPNRRLNLQLPALENLPPHNEDGVSTPHIHVSWWIHGERKEREANFFGGYRTLIYGGRNQPPEMETFPPLLSLKRGLYGAELKQHLRRYYGSMVTLLSQGAMAPNKDCYCEVDPRVKDRWGIPVLKFYWKWAPEDLERADHMDRTHRQIAKKMGARILEDSGIETGGNHDVGGAQMGADRSTSVLDSYCRTWGIPNLYVADGAAFVTQSEKNPTLTIMALALRAADHIIDRFKGGDL